MKPKRIRVLLANMDYLTELFARYSHLGNATILDVLEWEKTRIHNEINLIKLEGDNKDEGRSG